MTGAFIMACQHNGNAASWNSYYAWGAHQPNIVASNAAMIDVQVSNNEMIGCEFEVLKNFAVYNNGTYDLTKTRVIMAAGPLTDGRVKG